MLKMIIEALILTLHLFLFTYPGDFSLIICFLLSQDMYE